MSKLLYKLPLIYFGVIAGVAFILFVVTITDATLSGHGIVSKNEDSSLHHDDTSQYETIRAMFVESFDSINKNLPRPIAWIGQFDKVSFEEDTMVYYYTVYGDPRIDSVYENDLDEIRINLLRNMYHMMNGKANYGDRIAEFMNEFGVYLKFNIKTPSGRIFESYFKDSEPYAFLQMFKQSPAEAYRNMLRGNLKLLGYHLPMDLNTGNKVTNIARLSAEATAFDDTNILLDIICDENTVRYRYLTADEENVFELYRPYLAEEFFRRNFAQSIAEDLTVWENMRTMAMCNINYELRYIRSDWQDSISVYIPCYILKEICDLTQKDT